MPTPEPLELGHRLRTRALVLAGSAVLLALLGATLIATQAAEFRARWSYFSFYSRGVVVPLFAAYAAWEARHELRGARPRWSPIGGALLVTGLGVFGVGLALGSFTGVGLSLPLVVGGIAVLMLGAARARRLAFPIVFLVLMTPLPLTTVSAVSLPLQTLTASVSSGVLTLLGMPVRREGIALHLHDVIVEVTEGCNGFGFATAMIVIGIAIAWAGGGSMRRRASLVALAGALGIVGNWVRVVGTALIAEGSGASAAIGRPHELYGEIVYAVMVGLFVVLAGLTGLRRTGEPRSHRAMPVTGCAIRYRDSP